MKKFVHLETLKSLLLIPCSLLLLMTGCNPEQKYTTRNVTVKMTLKQLSAGFVEYEYTTDKDAYYAIGIVPCEEFPQIQDPYQIEEQFKNLVLDEYYMYYIQWRHELLLKGVPYIADYPSHTLFYGTTDYYHTFLRPKTDYWAFCFVVDPATNKAAGPLVLETIRTDSVSNIDVQFNYRIQGTWDYVYPMQFTSEQDTIGTILSNFPYMACTKSKDYLVQWCMNRYGDTTAQAMHTPAAFFIDTLVQEIAIADETSSRILFGEFAYNNVNENGEPTFEVGKEYYTAFAGCDGYFNNGQSAIYRFVWQGERTRLSFTEKDKLSALEW